MLFHKKVIFIMIADCNLFINCGGDKVVVDGNVYEADITRLGPSYFGDNGKWAYSSTGDFLDNRDEKYIVTSTNSSLLHMDNPRLYMTARLSPLSLKYYGFCLHEGNYTVKLHFAEIMFPDDQTFPSVGQRIFDVSIQVIARSYLHPTINCITSSLFQTSIPSLFSSVFYMGNFSAFFIFCVILMLILLSLLNYFSS